MIRAMCKLFDSLDHFVNRSLNYEYNSDETENSFEFIKHIRELPEDAKAIY